MLTLFVAGHETTGGVLSWSLYLWLSIPKSIRDVQQLVDSLPAEPTCGRSLPSWARQSGFKEALRDSPTTAAVLRRHHGFGLSSVDTTFCRDLVLIALLERIIWPELWPDSQRVFADQSFAGTGKPSIIATPSFRFPLDCACLQSAITLQMMEAQLCADDALCNHRIFTALTGLWWSGNRQARCVPKKVCTVHQSGERRVLQTDHLARHKHPDNKRESR